MSESLLGSPRPTASFPLAWRLGAASVLLWAWCLGGCSVTTQEPQWPPTAQKWFDRAEHSYRQGDIDDAEHASQSALEVLPDEPRIRLVAARVALAQLKFERALELTQNLPGTEAAGLRGRAHWYLGHLEKAADELEKVNTDPEQRDEWAEKVARLARIGRGRRPYDMAGELLAVMEMPRAGSTAMLVPIEVDGEPSLAMIATEESVSVIDSRKKDGGSWVSVRFDERVELSDVPAVGRDLSGLERQIGAPVKLLIGMDLLRQLRATIDFSGRQFVVRNYEPPPPPQATTVSPIYYQGGRIVLPGALGIEQTAPQTSLLMKTSMGYPVALDRAAWKKAGLDPEEFAAVPGQAGLRHGLLPMLRLGAFEIPNVPGVIGSDVEEVEDTLAAELDGFAGSGLFATFRLTFADGGRTLWLEDLPQEVIQARLQAAERIRARQRALQESGGPQLQPPETLPPGDPSAPGGMSPGGLPPQDMPLQPGGPLP